MAVKSMESFMKTKKLARYCIDYGAIFAGCILYAVSVSMFTAPNNIVPGGVTGLSTMINYLFGFPIGIMTIIINIPLFIWGAAENGKSFLGKTVLATVVAAVCIDTVGLVVPQYSGNTLLAALFGGIINGVGLALIFYGGGTTGGTDIIAKNINNHKPYLSIGKIIIIADIVVILGAMIVYGNIENGLYATITIFACSKVIDVLAYGFARDNGQLIYIISDNYEKISQNILQDMVRGVTIIDGHGAYSGEDKKVLMCAVRPRQVYKVKSIVNKTDPEAFMIVTKAGLINGRGFPADN